MTRSFRHELVAALEQGAAFSVLEQSDLGEDAPLLDRFISGVCEVSPFISRLIRQASDRLPRVLDASAADGFAALLPIAVPEEVPGEAKIRLRQVRSDLALAIALADLAGVFDVPQVVQCLSHFADLAVQQALQAAWQEVRTIRGLKFEGEEPPQAPIGLAIIAMGKHGAQELNYSSDIDLVAVYDPVRLTVSPESRLNAKAVAVKTVQGMVDILSQQTEHGFVFRTDLRLRPNPSATAVAVSLPAAEVYYEVYGQNWERAAYIKARPVAGDPGVGIAFMEMMRPFIWRRTLDFAAVADIHAVKKQIHAQKGNPELQVRGGNIKVGPGGIREVEFFAQIQQLLLGGRDTALRRPRTMDALSALASAGHIEPELADRLTDAYLYLRKLEHRLQMREDSQTQTVPEDEDTLSAIAAMMGVADVSGFVMECEAILHFVHDTYADLFDTPEPATPVPGSLVFTGVEDDPRTLETLRKLRFVEPEVVTTRIRRWHQGGLRATKSVRARELLTDLVPRILTRLGQLDDPDGAFSALDAFLVELPAGFQVFALFTANPNILDDVLLLCQSSPELARRMGRRPALVEGLLHGLEIDPLPFPDIQTEDTLEDRLDIVRRVINEHRTRVSAALVLGRTDPPAAGKALADMADKAIADLVEAVRTEMAVAGKVPGQVAVLGFGRLGTAALTPLSDLDLVFVYEAEPDGAEGETYYTRLIRRIVSALSVPTAEGGLFEIDMKLRPSGGAGPAAVSINAFDLYYRDTAWIWEQMALVKARVVTGDSDLVAKIDAVISRTLTERRDAVAVKDAVTEMRGRLLKEKPARSPFDVKRLKGALTDVDFIIQCLVLIHGEEIGRIPPGIVDAISTLTGQGKLGPGDGEALLTAYRCFECTAQYVRAVFGEEPPQALNERQAEKLRRLSPLWTADPLDDQLTAYTHKVADLFERYVGPYPEIS